MFLRFLQVNLNPHILLAERLDYLCSADEDHLDLIFGFYNYTFEYLPHNLVIVGHRMVCPVSYTHLTLPTILRV